MQSFSTIFISGVEQQKGGGQVTGRLEYLSWLDKEVQVTAFGCPEVCCHTTEVDAVD